MTDMIGPAMQFIMYAGIVIIIVIIFQGVIQWVIGTSEIIKQQKEIITLLQKQLTALDEKNRGVK